MQPVQPVTLADGLVRLEPLSIDHLAGLLAAAADGELWNLRFTSVPTPDDTAGYIERALQQQARGERLAFAVIDLTSGDLTSGDATSHDATSSLTARSDHIRNEPAASDPTSSDPTGARTGTGAGAGTGTGADAGATTGTVIGSTSFHDIVPAVDRLEIGWTWYAKRVQRTHVNTAVKRLLFGHAFETLGARLVGLRTDNFNHASQRAIERLGAKRDGVLRHHALRRDGTVRDTVMYSVTAGEWPELRVHLRWQLDRPR